MQTTLDLRGLWKVAFGEKGRMPNRYKETIVLPGTTEAAGLGKVSLDLKETEFLSRVRPHAGAVWYQRQIVVPPAWKGRAAFLELERSKYTSVWVDGYLASESKETIVPQCHNLTQVLAPGKHNLLICVDNDLQGDSRFPASLLRGHQYTDHTQTNWNGILGYIRLSSRPLRSMGACKADGKLTQKHIALELEVQNAAQPCDARMEIQAKHILHGEAHLLPGKKQESLMLKSGTNRVTVYLPVTQPECWDEFHPAYYDITMEMHCDGAVDSKSVRAAFRTQRVEGKAILVNEMPVFLRGTVDCAIFPQTGYPPTTVAAWMDVLSTAREYGMNHYRFHSWCPTEAAFEAADRLGMYLQVELPNFGNCFSAQGQPGHDPSLNNFLHDQAKKILEHYGNHPSFFIFAVGNEMVGAPDCFRALVEECRAYRQDILYTQGANNFLESPRCVESDDCWIMMRTDATHNIRASFSHNDKPLGHLQTGEIPGTLHTYEEALALSPLPLIAHEVGQYQVFPNLEEIDDFTGPLYPTSWMITQDGLEKKGLRSLSNDFVYASGKLAVECYREDVEALLRTKGMTGFQLLGLQDFPGQGTALVGIWDSFFRSKGLIQPEKWRQFCAAQVLMAKFPSYVHFAGDVLAVELLVRNDGDSDINATPCIELWSGTQLLHKHSLSGTCVPRGGLQTIGVYNMPLPKLQAPAELEMRIACGMLHTSYSLWVYPRLAKTDVAGMTDGNILVASAFTPTEEAALLDGKTVVLFSAEATAEYSVKGFFASDFWCWPMFRKLCQEKGLEEAPGTMGLLIDALHPSLAGFPTRTHAQWQWHAICYHSRPLILDQLNVSISPVVRVIDNFSRNHSLALVIEAKVARGKLLLIASDVLAHLDKPNVQALYHSVLQYAGRMDEPEWAIDIESIRKIFGKDKK